MVIYRIILIINLHFVTLKKYRVGELVEALRYQLESRGVDSLWHWNFLLK